MKKEAQLTSIAPTENRDKSILYGMPIPLVYLYQKIIRFLGKKEKNTLALVVTEQEGSWIFYISNMQGRFIHRIFIDDHASIDKRERNVDYYFTKTEDKKTKEKRIDILLENLQKNITFQHCGNSYKDIP